MTETTSASTVSLTLTEHDARFAVEHLRFLASTQAQEPTRASANLSARWLADEIERLIFDGYCTCYPERIGRTRDCGVRAHREAAR